MKKILTLLAAIISSEYIFSQPAIQWQNTIGGSSTEWLFSIQQTFDGGYILGGWSSSNISGDKTENSNGQADYWLVKTDSLGNLEWQNTIGGSGNDYLQSISPTSDGGYILGGYSESNISGDKTENSNGGNDYWLVKTDGNGNIQWQNTIGGNGDDRIYSIHQTSDGAYIIGGYSDSNISGDKTENSMGMSDYWLVKTDGAGNIQWQNTIGGNGIDELYSVSQTADGGYIAGGSSESNISGDKTENSMGSFDCWIVKTDSAGAIQWQNTIGGNDEEVLWSVQLTSDSGYVLAAFSVSNISGDKTENSNGSYDYWLVKTDNAGNIQWENTIGGSSGDYLHAVQQTADGGYILGGYSFSNISGDKTENSNGLYDYWIIKTDNAGNILWQNTIGGSGQEHLYTLQQTSDGGFILGSHSSSNSSGDKAENTNGGDDYWIIKLAPDISTSAFSSDICEENNIAISPNPTTNQLTIESGEIKIELVEIYNVLGEKVYSNAGTSRSGAEFVKK